MVHNAAKKEIKNGRINQDDISEKIHQWRKAQASSSDEESEKEPEDDKVHPATPGPSALPGPSVPAPDTPGMFNTPSPANKVCLSTTGSKETLASEADLFND
eukprot:1083655-Karenia_brevis.AAC.1